jgi:hypothetical protein
MQDDTARVPSLRTRVTLYFVGVAAMAVPWGYLLFVRPWLRARHRPPTAPHIPMSQQL